MKGLILFLLLFPGIAAWAQGVEPGKMEKLLAGNRYYELLYYTDSIQRSGAGIPELFYYQGKANEGVMRYNKAYACYRKWLESDTTDREARLSLAQMANLAGYTAEAMTLYEELAREDTLGFVVNYQLARILQQDGKPLKAIAVYERMLAQDSVNISLWKRLGECYTDAGRYPEAILCYRKAFFLEPRDRNLAAKAINIMLTYRALNPDYLEYAEEVVDTALFYSPDAVILRQNKGVVDFLNNRFERCSGTFADLILKGDSSRLNFKYQGLALYEMQKYAEAILPLRAADLLFRDESGKRTDLELSVKCGEAMARGGSAKGALGIFHEIEAQLQPDLNVLSFVKVMEGMAYAFNSNPEEAKKMYWEAYKLNPENRQAVSNFVNMNYNVLLDEKMRGNAPAVEIKKALYAQILLLLKVKDKAPASEDTMHDTSRKLLRKELEEMFFRGETRLEVMDPDGKKYVYSAEEIRRIIDLSLAS